MKFVLAAAESTLFESCVRSCVKHVPKFAGPVISAWCTSVVPQTLVGCVNPSKLENFSRSV